jgi:hypothetical protein
VLLAAGLKLVVLGTLLRLDPNRGPSSWPLIVLVALIDSAPVLPEGGVSAVREILRVDQEAARSKPPEVEPFTT